MAPAFPEFNNRSPQYSRNHQTVKMSSRKAQQKPRKHKTRSKKKDMGFQPDQNQTLIFNVFLPICIIMDS